MRRINRVAFGLGGFFVLRRSSIRQNRQVARRFFGLRGSRLIVAMTQPYQDRFERLHQNCNIHYQAGMLDVEKVILQLPSGRFHR